MLSNEPNAVMAVDEISRLGSIGERAGSSTFATLRTLLTGGDAPDTNTKAGGRRRDLRANTYSLGVVAGVQPQLSEILLSAGETAAGTPQRWAWMPAEDKVIPDQEPEWPGELTGGLGKSPSSDLWMDSEIVAFVKAQHRARQRGEGDALDGHAILTRLKVAGLLAMLHGESGVSARWWRISEPFMELSGILRGRCQAVLKDEQTKKTKAVAAAEFYKERTIGDLRTQSVKRVAVKIWNAVEKHSTERMHNEGSCSWRCLSRAAGSRDSELARPAVDMAVSHFEWLRETDGGRYALGASKPA